MHLAIRPKLGASLECLDLRQAQRKRDLCLESRSTQVASHVCNVCEREREMDVKIYPLTQNYYENHFERHYFRNLMDLAPSRSPGEQDSQGISCEFCPVQNKHSE